jgi:NAD(P)-dependent dehydrogenase (short-subunit alcohol dehydrogenase family)
MSGFDFDGSVAVVTGGASGIGLALATKLTALGSRVAVVDIKATPAEEAAAGLVGSIAVTCDVGDRAAVRGMVEQVEARLGPVDIYCSNAGLGTGGGLGEDEAWERSWRVHAMAHVHAARAVVPGMLDRGRGAFVVTASAAGLLMLMQSAPYTVTKHASVAIAEWLAVEYGGSGVQFHCVCPQGVRTPMIARDATSQAEVGTSGDIIEPSAVADEVVAAIRADRFLVLPHPQVQRFEQAKADDRDRWLAGMRRLRSRVTG